MEAIAQKSKSRAEATIRSLPLNSNFYLDAQKKGINAELVFKQQNQYKNTQKPWFKNPESIEAAFRWLIIVGILRREVDGQGLTSSVRLTPMGRMMLEENPRLPMEQSGAIEKIHQWISRKWYMR